MRAESISARISVPASPAPVNSEETVIANSHVVGSSRPTNKTALPAMLERGRGRIINIGAGAAAGRAAAGMGAYTASKAGVQRLTESLSDEVKDRGITVNAILPGTIDTPRNRADMPHADFTRWVAPEEIAEVILFLASDAARAVTGAAIPVLGRG